MLMGEVLLSAVNTLRQKVPNPLAMTQFVMGYAPEADCMTDAARPAPPMPADGLLLFALTCKKWRAFQQTLGPLRQKVGDLMACRKRWLGRIPSALELPENRIMRDHVLFTYGQAQGMPVRGPCLPNMPESTFDLMAAGGHDACSSFAASLAARSSAVCPQLVLLCCSAAAQDGGIDAQRLWDVRVMSLVPCASI